jgi:hypothetical protein
LLLWLLLLRLLLLLVVALCRRNRSAHSTAAQRRLPLRHTSLFVAVVRRPVRGEILHPSVLQHAAT